MRRLVAQIRKEIVQLLRDRVSLSLALLLPVVMLYILSAALALKVKDLPLVIDDQCNTRLSREYANAFASSLTFVARSMPVGGSPDQLLRSGSARAILMIPADFDRLLRQQEAAHVQILIDAADSNTANGIRGNTSAISAAFVTRELGEGSPPKVEPEIRTWFNPGNREPLFYGPGGLAAVLALFPGLLAALATAREGSRKTILQVYVSGITPHIYLLGKALAYTLVAIVQLLLGVTLLFVVFGIRFVGDPSLFFVGGLVYLFTTAMFGVMVGTVVPDEANATQLIQVGGFVLSFLLSGFLSPISNMPPAIRWVPSIVPATYYIEIARDAFLRGAGWEALAGHVPKLAAISLAYYVIAFLRVRRMQIES